MIEKTIFGTLKNGEEVEKITIKKGKYKVSILTFGAIINYFGTEQYNAVLSYETLREYEDDTHYFGECVGPVANRISNHKFTISGVEYILDKNEGEVCLHSASANFGKKNWSIFELSNISVTLFLKTKDGDGGFPGNHETFATYSLSEDGQLTISYSTISDKECPVYLTNHVYFNLSSLDIRDTILTLPSSYFIETDTSLLPTKIKSVEKTDYDFRDGFEIGKRRNGEYDNAFVLEEDGIVIAEGKKAKLEIRTNQKAIQVYTGVGLKKPFSGFALETGGYPDAINRRDDGFPCPITNSDKAFNSITTIKLEVFSD